MSLEKVFSSTIKEPPENQQTIENLFDFYIAPNIELLPDFCSKYSFRVHLACEIVEEMLKEMCLKLYHQRCFIDLKFKDGLSVGMINPEDMKIRSKKMAELNNRVLEEYKNLFQEFLMAEVTNMLITKI